MKKPAATGPVEVDDLDGTALRAAVSGNRTTALAAARDRYALAYQWCITHPAVDPAEEAYFTVQQSLTGPVATDLRVGGEGTPGLGAFAVEAYAATAGLSVAAGMQVLCDALDLHHRLPRLWTQVKALRVPAWTAARVAELTHGLSREAAAWIDTRLADRGRYGWGTIDATIKQAIAMFHPELLRPQGGLGREDWDVNVDHHDPTCADGTSKLEAVGDSLDLMKFHHLINDEAEALKQLGDTDTLGQRKAKALGVIADRQATLDLAGLASGEAIATQHQRPAAPRAITAAALPGAVLPDTLTTLDAGAEQHPNPGRGADLGTGAGTGSITDAAAGTLPRRSYLKTRLYLHLTHADLTAHLDGDSARVGDAGVLGPQLISQIEAWLTACGSDAKITPVIDLNHDWSVDRHDPPEAMREQVILRDQHCVFPHCTRHARTADLDHIEPYDPDGPPGQTSPENLAALCRRHHRMKTFTTWRYQRDPDNPRTYLWTSPHGEHWRVTPGHGTTRLPEQPRGPDRP